MTSVVAGRRRARKAGRDQTRAIDAGATSTAHQPVEFPPFNGDDVGALVLQCLTQHLPFDEEMAVVLSTYVSSVIDDAVGDPVETADAINTLLADSLADTSPEVLRDVKAFAKYLVNGMLDKHALQKQFKACQRVMSVFDSKFPLAPANACSAPCGLYRPLACLIMASWPGHTERWS